MANFEAGAEPAETEPRPAAVTFVTTEHFTLQGARSSTIAEATGRATMFPGAVSGGIGCPRADRYRRRRPHGVLRFRAHPVAHAGPYRAGDIQPGAGVRDRGPRLCKPDRAAA